MIAITRCSCSWLLFGLVLDRQLCCRVGSLLCVRCVLMWLFVVVVCVFYLVLYTVVWPCALLFRIVFVFAVCLLFVVVLCCVQFGMEWLVVAVCCCNY